MNGRGDERTRDTCRICGSRHSDQRVAVREMMFGSGDTFDYFRCRDCGTLQIADFPPDMVRHYPEQSYYSFQEPAKASVLRRTALRWAARSMTGLPTRFPSGTSLIDRLRRATLPWIAVVPGLSFGDRILDVGCGNARHLARLSSYGFTRLTGIDPFLPAERARSDGPITLIKGSLDEVDGRFDLVTMHHSLEHSEAPGAMLAAARERLAPGGRILVRIPLLQQWAWRRFGTAWSQIDAPRHFYLFTDRALLDLAAGHGLTCTSRGWDGQGWSIAWSEQWQRGIPAHDSEGRPNYPPLDWAGAKPYEAEARHYNAAGEGESGWFVFEPRAEPIETRTNGATETSP